MTLELQPKQSIAFETAATEVLFGGAAFVGKSWGMRVSLLAWCVGIPGLQCYLFRREYPDLWKNHMSGPGGFPELLAPWIDSGFAKINYSDGRVELGKSRIHLCHCQHEKDVYGYQGAEIHVLAIDELTQFTDAQYRYLRSRVRMVGLELPEWARGRFPRIFCSSNPGGPSHNAVKAWFIDPQPPMKIWRTPDAEGGMLRQFIPGLMSDNPLGMAADPGYRERLRGLGDPALVAAMELGDWNIVAGGAFDDLWRPEQHVIAPFDIPKTWRVDRSFDWGSSRPFSVGWWAESNGEEVTLADGSKRVYPRGTIFRIGEWYGWNGKPDEGVRMISTEIARGIVEREQAMGLAGRVLPGPADTSIFDVEDGKSIADGMAAVGVRWERADKSPGSRRTGLDAVRKFLKASLAVPMEAPGIYFFDVCRHALRTLPTLPRDPKTRDDVDTKAEDHCYDEIRYRVLSAGSFSSGAFG